MKVFLSLLTVTLLLVAGCKSTKSTGSGKGGSSRYSEDLAYLRPKPETKTDSGSVAPSPDDEKKPAPTVPARYAVNQQLNSVLDSIDRINRSRNYVEGFIIQVYSGLNREEALRARKELMTVLPDIDSEVQFKQPNFLVRAGEYYSRLDAQKDFITVKRYFPSAILIPDRIKINE